MSANRKKTLVILLLIIILLAIGITFGYPKYQTAIANRGSQASWKDPEIIYYEQELRQKNLNPEVREKYEALLQVLYYQATVRAESIRQLTEMPTQVEAVRRSRVHPTLSITEVRITGIVENPPVPFSPMDILIENAWQELVDGNYVIVYAGSFRKDPDQGLIIVYSEATHRFKQFRTPQKRGPVHITSYQGVRLVLQG